MRRWWGALLVAMGIVLGSALPGAAWAQALAVGVLAPQQGPEAEDVARAVEIFSEDHPSLAVTLAHDASTLAAIEGLAAVVAHLPDEAASQAAAEELSGSGIPFLAATGARRALARVSDRTYTATYTTDIEARRIAAYAAAVLGARRVAVLHADDASSVASAALVRDALKAVQVQVRKVDQWPGAGVPERYVEKLFPILTGLEKRELPPGLRLLGLRRASEATKKLQLDAVVVVGAAKPAAEVIRQLRDAGLDVPVLGTEALHDPALVAGLQDDFQDVFVPSGNSWDIETFEGRAWRERLGAERALKSSVLYVHESLQLVAEAAREGATDRDEVAAFLATLRSPEEAVRGLSALLYFDEDGVLQREPWFLRVHRGQLTPAFRQLRKIVDPRKRWRAEQHAEEAEEEAAASEDRKPAAGSARIQVGRLRVLPGGRVKAPPPPPLVTYAGDQTVTVGDESYHLTAVVYAGLDVFRINDIDVADGRFDVEMYLWFLWEGDDVDIESIGFLNRIHSPDTLWEVLQQDVEGDVKYVCYRIRARFVTPYDVRDFPYDTQTLPLSLSHQTRDASKLVLVVDRAGLTREAIHRIYPGEWLFKDRRDYSAMFEPPTTFGDPTHVGPASRSLFSVYQSEVDVQRILFPYVVTLFMPLGIMVSISLFVILIPSRQFEARLTLVMTALLSVVVFHLAQQEGLPNVGYLMRADQFFIVSYVLLFVLILQTILVNMLISMVKPAVLKTVELVFAAIFLPVVFLAYVGLTFGNPLSSGYEVPYWGPARPTDAEDEIQSPEPTSAAIEGAGQEAAPSAPVAPEAPHSPDHHYVICNGEVTALGNIVQPVLEKLDATEIPYTQSKSGGDQLRDCSGNFLRVSSWVAAVCPDAESTLAASAGVTDWNPGGNNVFAGTIQKWSEGGKDYAARSSRGTARWYHAQGLFRPVFADTGAQPVAEASADLKAIRNELRPGTVIWFAKPGSRITRQEGVERMFSTSSGERITHVGVVHSVERDDDGNIVSYRMYHGRRAYQSSDPDKQDNKITVHRWEATTGSRPLPPFGNWTEPVVGIAPLLPPVG